MGSFNFFRYAIFLFSFQDLNDMNVKSFVVIVPLVTKALLPPSLLFSPLFRLDNVYFSSFQFTDSSLCLSAV